MRAPFVRVGAVVDCERCGHRYTIQGKHVANSARGGPGKVAPGGADPVLTETGEGASGAEPSRGVDAQGNVIGLSGLSNLMNQEAPSAAGGGAGPGLRSGHTPPAPDADGGETSRARRARRRRLRLQRSTSVLVGGLCALAVLLGVILWLANPGTKPGRAPGRGSGGVAGPVTAATGGPAPKGGSGTEEIASQPAGDQPRVGSSKPEAGEGEIPLVHAKRLAPSGWTLPDEPGPAPAEPERPRVWLVDVKRVPQGGRALLTARVVSREDAVVDRAVVNLMLVDGRGREIAHAALPISLITAQSAVPINVPIPSTLTGRGLRVRSVVEHIHDSPGAAVLPRVTIQPPGGDSARATRVSLAVTNTTGRLCPSLWMVITAFSARHHVIGRWRVDWPHPLKAGQRVRLLAYTPLGNADRVARWAVTAAGGAKSPKAKSGKRKKEGPKAQGPKRESKQVPAATSSAAPSSGGVFVGHAPSPADPNP